MCYLVRLYGHSSLGISVSFSPNGDYLASGSSDKTICVWRVSNGELIKTLLEHAYSILSVVFSPNGEYLASGSTDRTIRLWRVSSEESIKVLTGHSN